jgi:hypothetical protein
LLLWFKKIYERSVFLLNYKTEISKLNSFSLLKNNLINIIYINNIIPYLLGRKNNDYI